jgi:hypothetical protein
MTDIGGSSIFRWKIRSAETVNNTVESLVRKSNGLRNRHACTEAFPAEARQAVRLL